MRRGLIALCGVQFARPLRKLTSAINWCKYRRANKEIETGFRMYDYSRIANRVERKLRGLTACKRALRFIAFILDLPSRMRLHIAAFN